MRLDKKVAGGQSRFVLAERIGRARFGEVVPASVLDAVLMEISESSRGAQPG
jgi:3-dehydroquinate synthetase